MKKPLLGLLLGGVLGVFDGLTALLSAPEIAPEIVGIVIGSTVKGLVVGVLVGWFATRVRSMHVGARRRPAGLGLLRVAGRRRCPADGQYSTWKIILPGSILGLIVGYATQSFGAARQDAELRSRTAP